MTQAGSMNAGLNFHELRGAEIFPWLDALGTLRIAVFREYPYLYDGSLDYERRYLQTYAASARSLVVLVTDGEEKPVGATTCIPLKDEGPEFQEPFLKANWDVRSIFYFGESILLPAYRGHGVGREFFRRRERHAEELRFEWTCFCAVDRPEDHPLRPPEYRPLDEFWLSLGYHRRPELKATFSWKETSEAVESPKHLSFWMKSWAR